MVDTTYPLFPIFAFTGFILSLIPLSWHLQAWNSGTCYFMLWSALACLNQFVNSVVWAGNTINHSPIWCEISIRIMMASSVGLPASSLCINRRLYKIASPRTGQFGHAEKSRAILIDTLICIVFPLVFVPLQYIVQGHRFDIFEDVGCYPALYNTHLAYFLSFMWPIVIGTISATYCILTLRAFARRRLEFSQFIKSGSKSLTVGRYFRLMALAMSDILLTTPLSIFTIYLNVSVGPVGPWRSWEDTHFNYSRIRQIPAFLWRSNHTLEICMEFSRWMAPFCALIFFAFFGFADEARKNYRKLFSWLTRPFGPEPWRHIRSLKGISSTWQFKTPQLPMSGLSSSSSSPSSLLPTYSPPPSANYPVLDIKQKHLTADMSETTKYSEDLRDSVIEKTSDCDGLADTPTVVSPGFRDKQSNDRFSWRTISVPFFGRRHSSYF